MSPIPRCAALPLLGLGLCSLLFSLSAPLRAEPQKSAPAPGPATATAAASPGELSEAQRQQLEALREKTARQLAPLREQLAARNKESFALWSVEPPNRAAILQKESEVAVLQQKMRQLQVEQRLSHLALLTPAQRATWRSQRGDGRNMGPNCGCTQAGREMGGMHGSGGNLHGGMGNMHGGMGMGGPGGMPMGMDDCRHCLDCMPCEAKGGCATGATSRPPAAPAAPGTP